MNKEGLQLQDYLTLIGNKFIEIDGKEQYHIFFHKTGNEMLHKQLEVEIIKLVLPYIEKLFDNLNKQNIIHIEDIKYTSAFILYGQMPIINDYTLSSEQNVKKSSELLLN